MSQIQVFFIVIVTCNKMIITEMLTNDCIIGRTLEKCIHCHIILIDGY